MTGTESEHILKVGRPRRDPRSTRCLTIVNGIGAAAMGAASVSLGGAAPEASDASGRCRRGPQLSAWPRVASETGSGGRRREWERRFRRVGSAPVIVLKPICYPPVSPSATFGRKPLVGTDFLASRRPVRLFPPAISGRTGGARERPAALRPATAQPAERLKPPRAEADQAIDASTRSALALKDLRELRVVSRCQRKLTGMLAGEKNRLHKLLDDAGTKPAGSPLGRQQRL